MIEMATWVFIVLIEKNNLYSIVIIFKCITASRRQLSKGAVSLNGLIRTDLDPVLPQPVQKDSCMKKKSWLENFICMYENDISVHRRAYFAPVMIFLPRKFRRRLCCTMYPISCREISSTKILNSCSCMEISFSCMDIFFSFFFMHETFRTGKLCFV